MVPMPHETNFLQRLLGVTRSEDPTYLADLTALGQTSMNERIVHVASFAGFISVFLTTALHYFSCYGEVLQLHGNGMVSKVIGYLSSMTVEK